VPRDHCLEDGERQALLDFHEWFPLEGYRRLTFMMLDQNVVVVSPSSTYRRPRQDGPARSMEPTVPKLARGLGVSPAAHGCGAERGRV
jgi:hypothetical protein